MIHVVTYVYDPTQEEQIHALRPEHRKFLTMLHANGLLRASGPWVGETGGAYLLMATESGEDALRALEPDPFYQQGVILERSVQSWDPVIGSV